MYLIAGLGNPDLKYLKTLHNMGFMTVETLAKNYGVEFNKKGFKAVYGEKSINGNKVIFVKPQTYMNLSGESLKEFLNFYKIPVENMLVFYDDIDLAIGSIRIRAKGSAGTHNGMRNIVQEINSENFPRIRIGTKPKTENYDLIEYVLSEIKKEDEPAFSAAINSAVKAGESFISGETFENIMCKFNGDCINK